MSRRILCLLLITCFLLTSCSNKSEKSNSYDDKSTEELNLNDINDFFSSQEGKKVIDISWNFLKAYFSADVDTMKELSFDLEVEYKKDKNVFDELTYLYLDWNFCNMESDDKIDLEYTFALNDESLSYFDMGLTKNNGEWYVTSYEFEK